ncbi:MAG: ATP-binding protein [Bacteroidota bacterium]|nr:ATP-binding protein [Bacteroidota bacterium]
MNVKSYNLKIVALVLLAVLFTVACTLSVIHNLLYAATICAIAIIITTFNLVYHVNSVNRKLTYFFDAIRNEDTTLTFPGNAHNKTINDLHRSLNRINQYIANIRLKNEQNEHFLNELMQSSASGLMAIDEKGYVEQVNQTALKIIGLPNLVHIHLLQQKNEPLFNVIEQLAPGKTQILKLSENSGIRQISVKAAQLHFADRQYRIFSMNDIRTEMEENELDSWQKLISVLTHEMMNSLAPITSLSNTLSRFFIRNGEAITPQNLTTKDIEQTLQGLSVIEERGKGLLHFVDNYRQLTRIPRPTFAEINIDDWFCRIKLLMQPRLDAENIHFSIQRTEQLTSFTGDEKLLSQVLLNLFNNSVDALKQAVERHIILHTSVNPQGNFCIHLTDNGQGITADNLDKIFVPFFTTKEKGSGIGLSLSRQIMLLHRGSITIQSVPERKTTVTLVF